MIPRETDRLAMLSSAQQTGADRGRVLASTSERPGVVARVARTMVPPTCVSDSPSSLTANFFQETSAVLGLSTGPLRPRTTYVQHG